VTETIVAAALKADDLIFSMPPPARHHTILHALFDFKGGDLPVLCDQGFVTSTGRYVDRTEGLRIAVAAKQTDGPKYQPTSLFSEDLW
jgi:hypothetical protein